MKKRYILALSIILIAVGGAGTVYTAVSFINKYEKYALERRKELFQTKEALNSRDKIDKLEIGDVVGLTDVLIKKSDDNSTKVNITSIKGREEYNVSLKDGLLKINGKEEYVNKPIGNINTKDVELKGFKVEYENKKYSIYNMPLSFIKDSIDDSILNNVDIDLSNKILKMGKGKKSKSDKLKIEIYIPNSVDLILKSNNKYDIYGGKILVDDGLIKNNVNINSLDKVGSLTYRGTIENININLSDKKEYDYKIYLDIFTMLNIKNINMNIHPGAIIDGKTYKKLADNIKINVQGERIEGIPEYIQEDEFNSEIRVVKYVANKVYPDRFVEEDSVYFKEKVDKLNKKIESAKQLNIMLNGFSDFINQLGDKDFDYEYENKLKNDIYLKYGISVDINNGICNNMIINAPNDSVRLNLNEKNNYKVKLDTKDGINFKYYLFCKLPMDKIKNSNIKNYNGDIAGYLKSLDPEFKETLNSGNSIINVNAKKIEIVSFSEDINQ